MPSANVKDFAPEQLSRDLIRQRQEQRLQLLLDRILPGNPFWAQRFAAAGLQRSDIRSLADLPRLPCVTKADLAADQAAIPPYGSNLSAPLESYTRIHQTSGTTGKPLFWLDTPANWAWTGDCWAQIFRLVGIQRQDRLCFAFSFGPFLGFWAAFDGAQRLGHFCLTAGGLSSEARLKMILDHQATIVCCTPTYAMRLAEVAASLNWDLAGSAVRGLIVAGEPGGSLPIVRKKLETAWGARVFDHWGMTELGPLAVEHELRPGQLLVLETECIAEILDPQGQPVPPGQPGELVITNLGRLDSPLLRYRTGDMVQEDLQPAPGLPQLLRLAGGIQGRADDMLTIRGNNVYPSVLEEWLRELPDIAEFRIHLRERQAMQHLTISVELRPGLDEAASALLFKQIQELFRSRLNFQVEVQLVPEASLPRPEMKGRRFVRE